ncbi:MAG: murein biosynthesis integral membrane protein MurJ [Gammaproteobacteria bacterium]
MGKKLLKTTGLVSLMTFVSRILGFVRDMLAAHFFGASSGYDAFLIAFKIPNFMRRLFAEGAFAQAFVPCLAQHQKESSEAQMQDFIAKVQGCMLSVLLPLSILGILSSALWVLIFAPGFDVQKAQMASGMLQITFPYILLISLTAIGGGILNTYGYYGVPAFTPVFLNLAMILAMCLGAYFKMVEPVYALAWGVFLGGICQLVFQWPFLKRVNLLVWPKMAWGDARVRRILTLMLPAILGVSVNQLNILIDTIFASYAQNGAVSWLYYADRLMEFPLGMFGVAIATVILPHLSRTKNSTQHSAQYSAILDWALKLVIFLGLPAALALALWAKPLMAVLFMSGKFGIQDVEAASRALWAYSPGILGLMLVKVLASAYYARQDTKTPVKIAIGMMLLHAVLNALFYQPWGYVGLALSTSITALLNAFLLAWVLLRRSWYQAQGLVWLKFMGQLSLGLLAMLGVWYFISPNPKDWFEASKSLRWIWLLGIMLGTASLFLVVLWLFGLKTKDLHLGGEAPDVGL